ncbi:MULTISPECIES: alanine racemase [Mesorhizobium]|uniref:alanine racemase n=1 Tax=Mesorhizobium TaxID=68287 RepID=UPI0010A96EB2|nr:MULTISPECIES: alanine racemase [Mesorhizobium]
MSNNTTTDFLQTPSLILDETRMSRNISRLLSRIESKNVTFRPHMKTAKCIEVARRVMTSHRGPITVSTLKEAEQFADAGVRDILYAVGIAPNKLEAVMALRAKGVDLSILVDSIAQAEAVAAKARLERDPIPVLIEIDADGYRGGVPADETETVLAVGRALHEGGAELRGILTYSGATYECREVDEIRAVAERERRAATRSAELLRNAGLPCRIVSVGSTPTAHFSRDFTGVTEVRAGVFAFFDLVMAGLGVCSVDDIALSVLATVIGHQHDRGRILVDAGWMAMSRDLGTAGQRVSQGYGVVCNLDGEIIPDVIMSGASQEHGILSLRPDSRGVLPDLPIGSMVRILPNHACATAAQHLRYNVVSKGSREVTAVWDRFSGW